MQPEERRAVLVLVDPPMSTTRIEYECMTPLQEILSILLPDADLSFVYEENLIGVNSSFGMCAPASRYKETTVVSTDREMNPQFHFHDVAPADSADCRNCIIFLLMPILQTSYRSVNVLMRDIVKRCSKESSSI